MQFRNGLAASPDPAAAKGQLIGRPSLKGPVEPLNLIDFSGQHSLERLHFRPRKNATEHIRIFCGLRLNSSLIRRINDEQRACKIRHGACQNDAACVVPIAPVLEVRGAKTRAFFFGIRRVPSEEDKEHERENSGRIGASIQRVCRVHGVDVAARRSFAIIASGPWHIGPRSPRRKRLVRNP